MTGISNSVLMSTFLCQAFHVILRVAGAHISMFCNISIPSNVFTKLLLGLFFFLNLSRNDNKSLLVLEKRRAAENDD